MSALRGPRRWALLASVSSASFVVMAFQVALTRVFSVLFSYHFAFLIVSGAICGLGLGGFGWYVLSSRRTTRASDVGWLLLAFALLLPGSILLLFSGPFLLNTRLWTAVLPLLPFALAGAFLADVFRREASESGSLYQADLAGASIAALLVIPLIAFTGALNAVFPLGAVAAAAAIFYATARGQRRMLAAAAVTAAFLLAAWPLSTTGGWLRLRPVEAASPHTKPMLHALDDPGMTARILDTEWTAYARTDLVRYDLPAAGVYSLQIFTDAGTPSLMIPFTGELDQISHLREWLPYAGFDLLPRGRLLSIGPGGGMDLLWGALAGFREMDGVEVNASTVRLVHRYRRLNGDIYHYPGLKVTVADGRSFLERTDRKYDLISCSLTQTGTAGNVGHALVESYIHTEEAFGEYYDHLTPDGRYLLVTEADDVLIRAAFTALAAMSNRGIEPAAGCRHLVALALPEAVSAESPYRYLLIWKRSPLTAADITPLSSLVDSGRAVSIFLPDGGGHVILEGVAGGFVTPGEVFEAGLTQGAPPVDLRPATDDHPFFLDLSVGVPSMLRWLLVGSVGVGLLFSVLFLRGSRAARRPLVGWLSYFSGLGIGFMLVEIPLIQKLILFLGHPTLSLTAVVMSLLLGASFGSRLSQRWLLTQLPARVAAAAAIAALLAVAYSLGLSALTAALLDWGLPARVLVTAAVVMPLGAALGIPFPSGLRLMSVDHGAEIPWMWGTNGLFSVTGSVLAAVGAKLAGFDACLLAAAVVYGVVAIAFCVRSGVSDRGVRRAVLPGRRPKAHAGRRS